MPEGPSLWDLPGPRIFANQAIDDCRAGRSVVLVLPDGRHTTQEYDLLLDQMAQALGATPVYAGHQPFAHGAAAALNDPDVLDGARDPLATLLHWNQMQRRCLIGSSWDNDLREPVRRWPALLKAAGHAAGDRPVLLLAVRACDIDDLTALLADTDQWAVAIHWFWEVISRLDTEVTVSLTAGKRLTVLQQAVVTELCGWDLAGAAQLAAAWDGEAASLPACVTGLNRPLPVSVAGRRYPSRQPPTAVVRAWNSGDADTWEGSTRQREALTSSHTAWAQWNAQTRLVFPRLEQKRGELEQLLRKRAHYRAQTEMDRIAGDGVLELGQMMHIVVSTGLSLPRGDYQVLRAARDARNRLAHSTPVPEDTLRVLLGPLRLDT